MESRLRAEGLATRRLAGAERFATGRAVAGEAGPSSTGEVLLALGAHELPGRAWPDALSAGALSAVPARLPVLLTVTASYAGASDLLASLVRDGGGSVQALSMVHDGLLPLEATTSGAAEGTYTYTWDENLLPSEIVLSSGTDTAELGLEWDFEGRLARSGSFVFNRETAGLVEGLVDTTAPGTAVTYDAAGRISQRTERVAGTATTTAYAYDPDGQLGGVSIDGAPSEAHTYDVNGNRTTGGATYDGQDRLTARDGIAYAFDRDGVRYHVATDQVGSPRVVSAEDGTIVKTVAYDAFGAVTADSDPGFALPLAFAGGLPDPVTGLVRFGFRDYEPASGRWTARDPLLFGGGQGNLYAYVHNDPVRFTDPLGLFCIGFSAYGGVGGGAQFCWDREQGKSVCFEVGLGVGGGARVSPSGMPAPRDDEALVGGMSATCGGVGLQAGFRLDNCGNFTTDPGGFTADEVGMGKGLAEAAQKGSLGCSVGAKLAGEVCRTW